MHDGNGTFVQVISRKSCHESRMIWLEVGIDSTKRKLFWVLFTLLSLLGWFLPFGWAVVETFVSLVVSWWLVYRSGFF